MADQCTNIAAGAITNIDSDSGPDSIALGGAHTGALVSNGVHRMSWFIY